MANMTDVIDVDATDTLDLQNALERAKAWGFLTGTQYATILDLAERYLPCRMTLGMRTKKGAAYIVLANKKAASFVVNNRGKLL